MSNLAAKNNLHKHILKLEKRFKRFVPTERRHSNADFLRFFIDDLLTVSSGSIPANLRDLIFNVFECLFKAPEQQDCVEPTWRVCKKLLRIFLPENLFELKRNNSYDPQRISVIKRLRPIIEQSLSSELKQEYNEYMIQHINLRYRGTTHNWKSNAQKQFARDFPQASDISGRRRKLYAKALFVLAQESHHNSKFIEDVSDLIVSALIFDKSWAEEHLMSKLCDTLVESMAENVCKTFGQDLLDLLHKRIRFLSLLILFNIGNISRAHLELGATIYTYNANFWRISDNSAAANKPERIKQTLTKSNVHFRIASKSSKLEPNDQWPSFYFLGKVGEKLKEPMLKIVQNYQKCARLMEKTGFRMFEPTLDKNKYMCFELLYRINRFLDKQREKALQNDDVDEMRQIVVLSSLFSSKQNKKNSGGPSECFDFNLESELQEQVPKLAGPNLSKLNSEAIQQIMTNYADILKRSRHQKTFVQLTKLDFSGTQNLNKFVDNLYSRLLESESGTVALIYAAYSADYQPYFFRHGSIEAHVSKTLDFVLHELSDELGLKRLLCFLKDTLYYFSRNKFEKYGLGINAMERLLEKCLNFCCKMLEDSIARNDFDRKLADTCTEYFKIYCSTPKMHKTKAARKFLDTCKLYIAELAEFHKKEAKVPIAKLAPRELSPALSPSSSKSSDTQMEIERPDQMEESEKDEEIGDDLSIPSAVSSPSSFSFSDCLEHDQFNDEISSNASDRTDKAVTIQVDQSCNESLSGEEDDQWLDTSQIPVHSSVHMSIGDHQSEQHLSSSPTPPTIEMDETLNLLDSSTSAPIRNPRIKALEKIVKQKQTEISRHRTSFLEASKKSAELQAKIDQLLAQRQILAQRKNCPNAGAKRSLPKVLEKEDGEISDFSDDDFVLGDDEPGPSEQGRLRTKRAKINTRPGETANKVQQRVNTGSMKSQSTACKSSRTHEHDPPSSPTLLHSSVDDEIDELLRQKAELDTLVQRAFSLLNKSMEDMAEAQLDLKNEKSDSERIQQLQTDTFESTIQSRDTTEEHMKVMDNCTQTSSAEHMETVDNFAQTTSGEVNDLELENDNLKKKLAVYEHSNMSLENKNAWVEGKLARFWNKNVSLENDNNELRKQVDSFEAKIVNLERENDNLKLQLRP